MASTQPATYDTTIMQCPHCGTDVLATVHLTLDLSVGARGHDALSVEVKAEPTVQKIVFRHDCDVDRMAAKMGL